MRKLRRWAFNALTILSLLLCIATAAAWVRSYSVCDVLSYCFGREEATTGRIELMLEKGSFELARTDWSHSPFVPTDAPGFSRDSHNPTDPYDGVSRRYVRLRVLGIGLLEFSDGARRTAIVPCWMVMVLTAAMPAIWLFRLLRRRIPPGHCPHCRYNLHANLSGTCPECGQPTAPAEPRRAPLPRPCTQGRGPG